MSMKNCDDGIKAQSATNKFKMSYSIGYGHIGLLLSGLVKQEITDSMVVIKSLWVMPKDELRTWN